MLLKIKGKISARTILLYSFCLLLTLLGMRSYFSFQIILMLPAFLSAALLYNALKKKLEDRRIRKVRRTLMLFLQYLCSGMAVGQSLRQLLSHLPHSNFYKQLSDRKLKEKLSKVALYVQTQQSGETYYPLLLNCFHCPEAKALLYAFHLEQQLGDKMLDFLRESFDNARELFVLEEEIAAANNRQGFESLIMAVLPFFMAPLFSDLVQISTAPAQSLLLGQIMRLLSFVMATLAFILQLSLSSDRPSTTSLKLKAKGLNRFSSCLLRRLKYSIPFDRLPAFLRLKLLRLIRTENLRRLFNRDKDSESEWLQEWFFRLISLFFIYLLLLSFSFTYLNLPIFLAFFLSLALSSLPVLRLRTKAKEQQAQMIQSLPLLLSIVTGLLKNGMGLNAALLASSDIFSSESALAGPLEQIAVRIQHGECSERLLEAWAEHLPLSDAGSALFLLAEYNRHGSLEILKMLEKQVALCRSEQRQNIRRRLDAKAGALLLPMLMDLISVMLLGAAPAMQIFSTF